MVLAAFSLKMMPFTKNLNAGSLFFNTAYQEMKKRLLYLFENMGIGLFTGEVGTGKSTLIRAAAQSLNENMHRIVYVHRGMDSVGNFYTQIALQLGIEPAHRKANVAIQVNNAVESLFHEQKIKTVLLIDEAHLLKSEVLDEIRLIHNAEMDSTDYLATAIVGQPGLRKTMGYIKFLPLAQRLSVAYHLRALSREEAYKYFEHHLKVAGAKSKIFRDNAVETVINAAKGIPRVINNISTKAMVAAANEKMTTVDQECVLRAMDEMGMK